MPVPPRVVSDVRKEDGVGVCTVTEYDTTVSCQVRRRSRLPCVREHTHCQYTYLKSQDAGRLGGLDRLKPMDLTGGETRQ
jgi:hypothetical protein